jgi:hypothetical protein
MPAVEQLLVGPSMPDRSNLMTQTNRDSLVFHIGGLAGGLTPHLLKISLSHNPKGGGQASPRNLVQLEEEE